MWLIQGYSAGECFWIPNCTTSVTSIYKSDKVNWAAFDHKQVQFHCKWLSKALHMIFLSPCNFFSLPQDSLSIWPASILLITIKTRLTFSSLHENFAPRMYCINLVTLWRVWSEAVSHLTGVSLNSLSLLPSQTTQPPYSPTPSQVLPTQSAMGSFQGASYKCNTGYTRKPDVTISICYWNNAFIVIKVLIF